MSTDFELTPLQKELMEAIRFGHADRIEDSLAGGTGLRFAAGYSDEKPLHIAAQCGRPHIIRLLVENGAPVDDMDEQGHTPLFHASEKGQQDAVAELLELGANLHHVSHTSRNALFCAALKNHVPVLETLLDAGADPNVIINGSTALLYAVGNSQCEAARFLVERGARLDILNSFNESALDIARRRMQGWEKGELFISFLAATQIQAHAAEGAPGEIVVLKPLRFKPQR